MDTTDKYMLRALVLIVLFVVLAVGQGAVHGYLNTHCVGGHYYGDRPLTVCSSQRHDQR